MIYKDSGNIADVSRLDGIVVLYASAFGNRDADGDIIARGAFKKTIQEQGPGGANRVKHLWMHWPSDIIGRPLELEEDSKGLRVVSKISKTQAGRDALILYEEGVITEHSVGMSHIDRDDTDLSVIKQARLWEYSSVTWGANPLTPTIDVKSLTGQEDEECRIPTPLEVQVTNAGRALSTGISDELCQKIESWLGLVKGHVTPEDTSDRPTAPQIDSMNEDRLTTLSELLLLSDLHLSHLRLRSHARNTNKRRSRQTVEEPQ